MKFKFNNKMWVAGIAATLFLSSCESDLDRFPQSEVTSVSVYSDFSNYKSVLAKIYAGLAVSGQEGGDGNVDIGGIDGGTSNYLRQYFQLQELPTDEAVIAWGDTGLPDLNTMNWGANNQFVTAMYYRIYFQVAMANEFIRETSDSKLASRNITGANAEEAKLFRNEARFMRALSYYHALDLFGNVAFVTEDTQVGITPPPRIERTKLFEYIEKELKDIENQLKAPKTNEYGRADQAAVWMLLSRLYLNAEVYTGTARYADARAYAEKVINSGAYTLQSEYSHLFLADNHLGNTETIFSINFDGTNTRTWGGTTYLVRAAVGGSMKPKEDFGINGGWWGLRTTQNMVALFPDATGTKDKRGTFHTAGHKREVEKLDTFTDGYALIKFKNVKRDGTAGSDVSGDFVDTDFPMFRLAEAYLTYAEAVLKGGGGSQAQALAYVNKLRERAYGNTSGNVASIDLDFILDERARELSWEAVRRTDLIRFNKFTSSAYVWAFKGGAKEGQSVADHKKLYPIPANELVANRNLVQNQGY